MPRPMSKTLFLTGASGFVGSAALQHVMENTDWRVICPSTIRHYGSQSRLLELREKYGNRIRVVPCDLSMPFHADLFGEPIDYIWNIASESHVDRSLTRSEEHTSELQSLMRISYAVFCLKKKNKKQNHTKEQID